MEIPLDIQLFQAATLLVSPVWSELGDTWGPFY